jgi:hypothetical protein
MAPPEKTDQAYYLATEKNKGEKSEETKSGMNAYFVGLCEGSLISKGNTKTLKYGHKGEGPGHPGMIANLPYECWNCGSLHHIGSFCPELEGYEPKTPMIDEPMEDVDGKMSELKISASPDEPKVIDKGTEEPASEASVDWEALAKLKTTLQNYDYKEKKTYLAKQAANLNERIKRMREDMQTWWGDGWEEDKTYHHSNKHIKITVPPNMRSVKDPTVDLVYSPDPTDDEIFAGYHKVSPLFGETFSEASPTDSDSSLFVSSDEESDESDEESEVEVVEKPEQVHMVIDLTAETDDEIASVDGEFVIYLHQSVDSSVGCPYESWLIDSGATVHVTTSEAGMADVEHADAAIIVGNGKRIRAMKKGSLLLQTNDGKCIKLNEVLVAPDFKKQIISLPRLLQENAKVSEWTKAGVKLRCPTGDVIKISREPTGHMYYLLANRVRMYNEANTLSNEQIRQSRKMDINEAHEKFAHISEVLLRKTAKKYGYQLTRKS